MEKTHKGTFNHSVKVPKLYKCAAKIAKEVAEGAGSIKQLVYEKTHFNTKALYALVATTFQKSNEIDFLLKRTKLLDKETRLDSWLAKILISELLWGKGHLPNSNAKPIQTVNAYEQAFRAHLSDTSKDNFKDRRIVQGKPRYIRINTITTSVNEALELFQEEGWTLLPSNKENTYQTFLQQLANLEDNYFLRDFHIADLLIFPCGTEFYNHPGYKKGAIILQDKASCLPVHMLSPAPGSVVLDMCAAPGMKTTQLAAILQDNGTVYAVERDEKRFEILKKMVEVSGATCVKVIKEDVLQCNGSNFPNVEYIIVDPSCSGSGMVDRFEVNKNQDNFRLQKLAGFQIKILRSALTRYPNVKKVVYSTCSLNPEENEDVVRQVLETNNEFKLVPADNFINKQWINYGSSDFGKIGKYTLYTKPDVDLTNGFFVAVFERMENGENNEFYNGRILQYRKKIQQNESRKERKYKENLNVSAEIGDTESELIVKNNEDSNLVDLDKKVKNKRNKNENDATGSQDIDNISTKKSKKKKIKEVEPEDNKIFFESTLSNKKTKKKKHLEKETVQVTETSGSVSDDLKRKKKKNKLNPQEEPVEEETSFEKEKKSKKNKKKKLKEELNVSIETTEEKPRKKKKVVENVY